MSRELILKSLKSRTVKVEHRYSGKQGKWGYWIDPYFGKFIELYPIPYIDENLELMLKSYGY